MPCVQDAVARDPSPRGRWWWLLDAREAFAFVPALHALSAVLVGRAGVGLGAAEAPEPRAPLPAEGTLAPAAVFGAAAVSGDAEVRRTAHTERARAVGVLRALALHARADGLPANVRDPAVRSRLAGWAMGAMRPEIRRRCVSAARRPKLGGRVGNGRRWPDEGLVALAEARITAWNGRTCAPVRGDDRDRHDPDGDAPLAVDHGYERTRAARVSVGSRGSSSGSCRRRGPRAPSRARSRAPSRRGSARAPTRSRPRPS